MSKYCSGMIILWHCLASFRSGRGPDSSHLLCSCDTTTFGSPTVPSSLIGFSIGDLSLAIPNVNDGVCYLSSGNYVPRESEASPNVDINVLTKILILEIKHIFLLFFSKTYNIFLYKKSQGFNKV